MNNQSTPRENIHVSTTYRWVENGHILLWLIKDTCWAMEWETGGTVMIFPTLAVAFYITWKSRIVRAELFHNIAVCLWIIANSVWMVGEFYDKETRHFAVMIFATGLILLVFYYLVYFKKDKQKEREYTLSTSNKT
jgi:hypothetical protein